MRTYMEKNQTEYWWMKPLKAATIILISIAAMLLLTLLTGVIISKTGVPESAEGFLMVAIGALTSLLLSVLLTVFTKQKPIFSALYAFVIMFLYKLFMTTLTGHAVNFGKQGIIGIAFAAVFCLIGSLIGANIKK